MRRKSVYSRQTYPSAPGIISKKIAIERWNLLEKSGLQILKDDAMNTLTIFHNQFINTNYEAIQIALQEAKIIASLEQEKISADDLAEDPCEQLSQNMSALDLLSSSTNSQTSEM